MVNISFKCFGKHHVGIWKHHVGICAYTPKEEYKNNDSKSDENDKKVDSDGDKRKVEDKTK